jgi:hypothetical protein
MNIDTGLNDAFNDTYISNYDITSDFVDMHYEDCMTLCLSLM